jgi:GxxExxY protein
VRQESVPNQAPLPRRLRRIADLCVRGSIQKDKLTPRRQDTKMTENEIGKVVVDAAVKVHRELGPGLLETVYEVVLARELERRGLRVERQVPVPIVYEGMRFEEGFRADIVVEGKVILELKSVEQMGKVHAKQVFTYLKLKGLKLGFVLNFGANLMKEGIERVVNGLPEENLGVLASLRETRIPSEPGGASLACKNWC